MKIKQLEWESRGDECIICKTIWGIYSIEKLEYAYELRIIINRSNGLDVEMMQLISLDEAKLCAQLHFESIVLSFFEEFDVDELRM